MIDLPALKILREAIKAVPSVKYALGVLGIVAAVAIATAIGINLRITIIGTVVGMTLMVVLVVFASLSLIAKEYILWPALVMLWSSTVLFVVFVSLLLISAFFAWPLDLTPWIIGSQVPSNGGNSEIVEGIVSGKVVTPTGKGIVAEVKLASTQADKTYQIRTSFNGEFSLIFNWEEVKKLNRLGVTWKVYAEAKGYTSNEVGIDLSQNIVEPERVTIVLTPKSVCEAHFPRIDDVANLNKKIGPNILYFFDLQSNNIPPTKLDQFLRTLTNRLDHGVRSHLEDQGLLGGAMLYVRWCQKVPVESDECPSVFGQRLSAPAVIWGYIEKKTIQASPTSDLLHSWR